MTDRPDSLPPAEGVQRELQQLSRPLPSAAFRARMKCDFVAAHTKTPTDSIVPIPRIRRWAGGAIGVLAAAAAVIVVSIVNRGPQWEVRAVTGTGVASIDGRSVSLADTSQLIRSLHAGARLAVPESAQLDLVLPGFVVMQVTGGTEATIPGGIGRWFGRSAAGTLVSGELRFTTGPRFHGTRLRISTPEAIAEVTGTTFALIRNGDSSCVCVLEGAIAMSGHSSPADTVHAGFRRSVYRDGRTPLVEVIRRMEVMKLTMLRDQPPSPARRWDGH